MLTRIYKEDKDALKEYLMSRTQDLSTDVLVTVSNNSLSLISIINIFFIISYKI